MFYFVRELGTNGFSAYLCVLVRDPLGGLGYGFSAPLAAVKIVPGGTAVLAQNQKTRDQPRLVCIGSLKETSSREGGFSNTKVLLLHTTTFLVGFGPGCGTTPGVGGDGLGAAPAGLGANL